MADDKKNIPDAGKVDEPPKPGKVEPVKADFPVQDQPAPAKTEAPVTEDASKVVTPPTAEKPIEGKTAPDPAAEQPAPGGKEVPKDKDAPAPSKEGAPQPGKDEKQTTIPGMGDPTPAGKVVDFTAARDGATKGKPPEKTAAPDKGKQADKAKDAAKPRRGRPARADKAAPDRAKPQPRDKMSQSKPPAGKGAPATAEAPAATEQPPAPRDATRGVKEEIVYLNLSELHPFKNHPFGVRDDAEMQGLVESVKAAGVNQPALVRPREGGGYEIIAGHRRQRASELAGFANMPCIVRNMTDDEANLKQMAAALQFMREHQISEYDQLTTEAEAASTRFHALTEQLRQTEADLAYTSELMGAVVQYAKTRPVFDEYKAAKYNKRFLAQHEAELADYRAAKAALNDLLDGAKLPKMAQLKEKRRKLAAEKKALYAKYRAAQQEMRQAVAVKTNIDYLLGVTDGRKNKEQER